MAAFDGFPPGRARVTPLPDLFFSELLAQIDDLAELKLTLHVFWRLARRAAPVCISRRELAADANLKRALGPAPLDEAISRAVARRSLIELRARNRAGESERFYFLNSPAGRRDLAQIRQGKLALQRGDAPAAATDGEKPNIFALYEQHIGMLTPLIAEQLEDAAAQYPPAWVTAAFDAAVRQDKRSWRYVEAVLQHWQRDGKQPERARRTAAPPPLKRNR